MRRAVCGGRSGRVARAQHKEGRIGAQHARKDARKGDEGLGGGEVRCCVCGGGSVRGTLQRCARNNSSGGSSGPVRAAIVAPCRWGRSCCSSCKTPQGVARVDGAQVRCRRSLAAPPCARRRRGQSDGSGGCVGQRCLGNCKHFRHKHDAIWEGKGGGGA